MSDQSKRIDPEAVLSGLKDFQRDTVEYIFRRMYTDPDATRRFLVADEVGLGKTLVARGVIAKAIDHLWDRVDRIDVIYICSNGDIARQNINRLKVGDQDEFALASRITLLPTKLRDLESHKLNFISFTPGTSFDLKSSLGRVEERALIYWLLVKAWGLEGDGAARVLQGNAQMDTLKYHIDLFDRDPSYNVDVSLAEAFVKALDETRQGGAVVRESLRSRFEELCARFQPGRDSWERARMVAELRMLLAATCITSLHPDLIILDEFQRFKNLLDGSDDASILASRLFECNDTRILLLSATPYKMYTLASETSGEDHYQDFLRTAQFLLANPLDSARLRSTLGEYRQELFRLAGGPSSRLSEVKGQLESMLRKVMVRTERLAVSQDRDGMLVTVPSQGVKLESQDLQTYMALQQVSRVLGQGDTMEYWKSAPYLLNFMAGYKLKQSFGNARIDPTLSPALAQAMSNGPGLLLDWQQVATYGQIDSGNARLRGLLSETVDAGAWQLLWMPPSLPYYQLGGPFAEAGASQLTKRLIFSSWKVVPRVVAALLSYEAERRMMQSQDKSAENSAEARSRQARLLDFRRDTASFPVIGFLYPSSVLANECDPLVLAAKGWNSGGLQSASALLERAAQRIERLLASLPIKPPSIGRQDDAWYGVAPILLDLRQAEQTTTEWLSRKDLDSIWSARDDAVQDEDGSAWSVNVERLKELALHPEGLGRMPDDLAQVLAQIAMAGPGVVALRSLTRVSGSLDSTGLPRVRDCAAQVAWAFRRLFNLPEVTSLLRGMGRQPQRGFMAFRRREGREDPYWRRVLEYCVNGGLQAALDEYAHILRDSIGVTDKSGEKVVSEVAAAMRRALTLRTASLGVDELSVRSSDGQIESRDRKMRASFALRFGQDRTDDGTDVTRPEQVRESFNSPFWPFVLATTSVGQEGLDFHCYCHAVVHWNLPSNPVDLEQREGRVHRYKGHAVRKNVAASFGKIVLSRGSSADPWDCLFEAGASARPAESNDLVPFWVFPIEGGARIERHVPALPMSRDVYRLEALRRSITVYRMVFGQPRQEDLLAYLLANLPESQVAQATEDLRIDLSPPQRLIEGRY